MDQMSAIDIFPWDDNFNTGLPKVDEQHRVLVRLLNLLASHVAFEGTIPRLNEIFDELSAYAVYHFETEEAIWHQYFAEDPIEIAHKAVHRQFVTTVTELRASQDGKSLMEVTEAALAFLARWLASHILETDRQQAYVVHAIQEGATLTEAKAIAEKGMTGATRTLIDIILSIYGTLSTNTLHLMREIAERKRNEERLASAMHQVALASRAKSRFLSNVTHEIRTPLNGILGMGQLLLMPDIAEDERKNYAATIIESGHSLLTLLNGVIDVAALETGDLVLQRSDFDPAQIVHDLHVRFAEQAQRKELYMGEIILLPTTGKYVGDVSRIKQLLGCLIDNAIKFTDSGSITIQVDAKKSDLLPGFIEFAVCDTGIGISSDNQLKLFQTLTQIDDSTTRPFGGLGIGLSIVHELTHLMQGSVGVESTLGKGSRFWIRIPVTTPFTS